MNPLLLRLTLLATGSFLVVPAFADCLPGWVGQDYVMADYKPSKNWHKRNEVMQGHFDFLLANYGSGVILNAGPLYAKDGEFLGGRVLFKTADVKEVATLLLKDPVLVSEVSTAEVTTWGACVPEISEVSK